MSTTANNTGHPHHAFVVEWREGFKTGVAAIDDEHQHLFTLVKRLELENVKATLDELLEYVVSHFTNEQALMENTGYPGFEAHLALHEQLSAQVAEFLGTSEEWTDDRVQELRRFLNKWLVGHILTHDLRFAKWYVEYGTKQPPRGRASLPKARSSWFDRLLGRS
jgi:hemerythrin